MNVHTANLFAHATCVYLTHVASAIRLFDLPNVQLPGVVVIIADTDASIVGHHLRMQGQNRLILSF